VLRTERLTALSLNLKVIDHIIDLYAEEKMLLNRIIKKGVDRISVCACGRKFN
jgi:hypothetical protein